MQQTPSRLHLCGCTVPPVCTRLTRRSPQGEEWRWLRAEKRQHHSNVRRHDSVPQVSPLLRFLLRLPGRFSNSRGQPWLPHRHTRAQSLQALMPVLRANRARSSSSNAGRAGGHGSRGGAGWVRVNGSERTDDGPVSTIDLFGGWFGGFRHSASPSSIAAV